MVKVKLTDGRTIRMIWHYDMDAVDPIYGKPSIQTSCYLTDDTEEGRIEPISVGHTIKSKKDNHCKETARAKSLERACRNANFDPYTTDQVLIAYKHRPRPKNVEVFDVLTPEQAQAELDTIFADTMINTMSVI